MYRLPGEVGGGASRSRVYKSRDLFKVFKFIPQKLEVVNEAVKCRDQMFGVCSLLKLHTEILTGHEIFL